MVLALGGSWTLSWLLGGAGVVPPHWFYGPILLAAARFGHAGAFIAALAGAFLAGPLLPLDVQEGSPQAFVDWAGRGAFFLALGQLAAALMARLRRAQREARESAQALEENLRLLEAAGQARRELLARVMRTEEITKRRIAEDVHDDTAQVMSAALLRLQLLERRLSEEDRARVHQASSSVGAAMERLRGLIFQLRPLALDYEGLEAAVRVDAARVFDETPITPTVRSTLVEEPDTESRAAAFRIVHEALANVRQHADASAVRVSVGFEGGGILVTVVDDGVGFEAEARSTQPGHLGLMSMCERAEAYGGWCEISSEPDRGTEVRLWLPVQMEPQLAVAKQA